MRVIDIINQAVAKAGLAEVDAVPTNLYNLALSFLNRKYETVWNAYAWREEKLIGVSVSASAEQVIFPQEVDSVRAIYTTDGPITPLSEIIIARFAPESFDDTGSTPYAFFNRPDSPVLVQPTAATTIKIKSDSTADTSLTVRIGGTVNGVDAFEDMTLNGTTTVTSSKSFSALASISKPLTTGRVTIMDSTTAELGTIAPWDYKGAYRRISLQPIPSAAVTIYAQATRRFPRLTSDSDTIILSKAEDAIFEMLMAELFQYSGDYDRAAVAKEAGAGLLAVALQNEQVKDLDDLRAFPDYGMFGGVESNSCTDPTRKTF